MKTALAVIAILGVVPVVVTEPLANLNCYQCTDMSMDYGSEELNDMWVDQGDPLPRCNSTHRTACSSGFDLCVATSASYMVTMAGMTMTTDVVYRGCGVSSAPQTYDQETVCEMVEEQFEQLSPTEFSCRVDSCSSRYCNTHGMQTEGDRTEGDETADGDYEEGEETADETAGEDYYDYYEGDETTDEDYYDRYDTVASGTGLKVTFLVTAFTAVAIFQI